MIATLSGREVEYVEKAVKGGMTKAQFDASTNNEVVYWLNNFPQRRYWDGNED